MIPVPYAFSLRSFASPFHRLAVEPNLVVTKLSHRRESTTSSGTPSMTEAGSEVPSLTRTMIPHSASMRVVGSACCCCC